MEAWTGLPGKDSQARQPDRTARTTLYGQDNHIW
jgi:hypothetical protein